MSVQSYVNNETTSFIRQGMAVTKDNAVIAQDATRSAALAPFTVLTQNISTLKYGPLNELDFVPGKLVCGESGGLVGDYNMVTDGSFKITADGIDYDITGLDFQLALTMTDVTDIITAAMGGAVNVVYDASVGTNGAFSFVSKNVGIHSSVSLLTAGSAGTDISGASYLNGLTGTGTVTAGTGERPAAIYLGPSIAAADLVAGDISDVLILLGFGVFVDEDQLIFENSLTMDSPLLPFGVTVRGDLQRVGILGGQTIDITGYAV